MSNNNFAETLASVASEFGVEDTEKHGRGIKPSKRPYFKWTEEQLEQLATLRDEGKSANEIAEALGVSSDKVVTKLAAMAARQRTGSKTPELVKEPPTAEPTDDEDEIIAAPVPKVYVPDEALDRMIFTAFDAVVGRVDDFNKMAAPCKPRLPFRRDSAKGGPHPPSSSAVRSRIPLLSQPAARHAPHRFFECRHR